jgi:predicted ribosome quality control (RQC) complex YloA/Tae2 family protein
VNASASVSIAKPRILDERKPYHTFHATNGSTIWVGRSSRDNDALVTRIANPHDLWLHAKNIRGAHVVVPLEKNRSCPAEVLVDAATLAAHFSDARDESTCDVSYVERRHVRKPKKSAPGSVTTQREKVIVVRIEKSRLARLLGSKVET